MLGELDVDVQKYCHLALCKRLVTHSREQGMGHSVFIGADNQAYNIRKNEFQV